MITIRFIINIIGRQRRVLSVLTIFGSLRPAAL